MLLWSMDFANKTPLLQNVAMYCYNQHSHSSKDSEIL